MSYEWDSASDAGSSVYNSDTSGDEEDFNTRVSPYWYRYRKILESRGYRLDCVRDVKVGQARSSSCVFLTWVMASNTMNSACHPICAMICQVILVHVQQEMITLCARTQAW